MTDLEVRQFIAKLESVLSAAHELSVDIKDDDELSVLRDLVIEAHGLVLEMGTK